MENINSRQKKQKEKEKQKQKRLQELREKGLISPSSDWTIDSETNEPLRKAVKKLVCRWLY